jgi:G3E family GTPase
MSPDLRLNLLFGFLGSGKTTLARRLLDQPPDDRRTAIIVNEFGDVGVDGKILSGRNVNMVELNSGCLCCTLKGPLLQAVEELHARAGAKRIIVEATGVAQPEDLLETFGDPSLSTRCEVGPVVTVVDASRYVRLSEMLGEFYSAQIENADLIILNKTDLATAEALENVRNDVSKLNPDAEILFSERCEVSVEEVLNGPASAAVEKRSIGRLNHGDRGDDVDHGHDHDHEDSHNHRHAPADSFVLSAEGLRDVSALHSFFSGLPPSVWRAKGFVVADGFSNTEKGPCLVQYAMGPVEIIRSEPRTHYNIVFIGRGMDREELEASLRRTLVES